MSACHLVAHQQVAKNIQDAVWTQIAGLLHTEALRGTRAYVAVNPAHTSQTCLGCKWRNTALTLADRTFRYPISTDLIVA